MATTNLEHQNRQWIIRPCDLDQLTRFCPENEISLFKDEKMINDPDFQQNSVKNLENSAAVDSLRIPRALRWTWKTPLGFWPPNGPGGSTRFVPHEEDAEEFINRQIQEVLCFQEEGKRASSLSDSQKIRKDVKRIGDTKAVFKKPGAEGSGNTNRTDA